MTKRKLLLIKSRTSPQLIYVTDSFIKINLGYLKSDYKNYRNAFINFTKDIKDKKNEYKCTK